jgi:putative flippase GtrA
MQCKELLRDFFRKHRWRLSKSLAVSGITTGVGFTAFLLLTSVLHAEGLRATAIYLLLAAPMTLFGFAMTRFLVWNDRKNNTTRGFRRWTAKSIFIGTFSQSSFFLFVGLLGFQHTAIAVALIIVKAPLGYTLNHWVFQEVDDSKMA